MSKQHLEELPKKCATTEDHRWRDHSPTNNGRTHNHITAGGIGQGSPWGLHSGVKNMGPYHRDGTGNGQGSSGDQASRLKIEEALRKRWTGALKAKKIIIVMLVSIMRVNPMRPLERGMVMKIGPTEAAIGNAVSRAGLLNRVALDTKR